MMLLTTDEQRKPFKALLDAYDQCFYNKDIEGLKALYVTDGGVSYFDNHAHCDSRSLADHLKKVGHFFNTGNIVRVDYADIEVYEYTDSALLITMVRYSNKPKPGVRVSYFLEKQQGEWRIRHIHCSSDPNEEDPTPG